MPTTLSVDLRQRVASAVSSGATCRQAAERFGVSRASASRWSQQKRRVGHVAPKPLGGDQRSRHIEAHADLIRQTYQARPQVLLRALREALQERGVAVSTSSLSRFFARHRITPQKGALHAAEQEREDVRAAREAWFEAQPELDPDRLVFLDETATNTSMVRRDSWAPRGERCRIAAPAGHWKTTTVIAGLRTSGPSAVALLDGPVTGERFRTYVAETLVPTLRPGDTLILDNLGVHKVAGVREAIEAAGARLLYLPPYSPEFNPIEQAFAKLTALLLSAAARTVSDLWAAIHKAFTRFSPEECRNYFTAAGYEDDACASN
ncbi:IS630 family transposase [Methylobacterium sp. PvR107]|uniref:IS630 family transposase n=1 Tax=Methylobacterium sp. PvR107 TaxID=2806597 RepID=UPI00391807F0